MDEKIEPFHCPYKKGDPITPDQAMQLAIDVAGLGAPYVSPNPLVGCVVVSESHEFIDFGFHQKYGLDHAEINALKKLNPTEIANARFYVTLEPCAHEGKTPSCAKTLAKLPIKEVIFGLIDPNPLVAGQGAEILNQSGIKATEYKGSLKTNLTDLCEIFLKNFTQKKVFVAAKVASSLDGQIALKTGESKWITGEESRMLVHELRSYYDAIIIGRNTIEVDDPSLNIRHPQIIKENKVIILDPSSELLKSIVNGKNFKFLNAHQKQNIFFAVNSILPNMSYNQVQFSDLDQLCQKLWDLGIRSLFIEGGAKTYSYFFQNRLVDRLYLFLAPAIIGNKNGVSWTRELGIDSLSEKKLLNQMKVVKLGSDIMLSARMN